jgi:glycosyltransferase involved in cell wall biosynthesis
MQSPLTTTIPATASATAKLRLALVGPLPPFRSGIAQHMMMLSRALEDAADLLLLSFTRQYPKWLFPGESDVDPDATPLDAPHVRYMIDSLNPLTWARAATAIFHHRPDAVVIPWWTIYWAPCFLYLSRRLGARGIPVYFFCHNVIDHEAARWKRALTAAVLCGGDGFFTQSEAERARLHALVPGARVAVHPHPIYTQFPKPSQALPRRATREFLFFGFVRPYKGLDILLRALAVLPDRDVMLTVAGEFWGKPDTTRALIDELGIVDQVELIARYVSETEAANLFHRADALIMPYRSATGSGVLGLAYNYGKPVIASAVPGLAEVVREGETGFLVEPESPEGLALALAAMSADRARAMAPAIAASAAGLTWESLAETVLHQINGGMAHNGRPGRATGGNSPSTP